MVKDNKYVRSIGFKRSDYDPNLYIKGKGEEIIIMVVCVDYLVLTCGGNNLIQEEKDSLCEYFESLISSYYIIFWVLNFGSKQTRFTSHRTNMLQNC